MENFTVVILIGILQAMPSPALEQSFSNTTSINTTSNTPTTTTPTVSQSSSSGNKTSVNTTSNTPTTTTPTVSQSSSTGNKTSVNTTSNISTTTTPTVSQSSSRGNKTSVNTTSITPTTTTPTVSQSSSTGKKASVNTTSKTPSTSTPTVSTISTTSINSTSNNSTATIPTVSKPKFSNRTSTNTTFNTSTSKSSFVTSSSTSKGSTSRDAITTTVQKKYPTVIPALDEKVELKFEIEVGNATSFKKELNDHNSATFRNYSKAFNDKLSSVFNSTPGFKKIEVYGFRNGSIIALYRLILESYIDVKNATEYINTTVLKKMEKLTPINGLSVNYQFVRISIERTIKQINETGCEPFSQDICPVGFKCSSIGATHFCFNMCVKNEQPLCGEHGTCYIDERNYTAKCSCLKTNGYVYYGEHCESSAEELKLGSIYIIAIAAGCGGALLIVVTVLTICLIRARRKRVRSPIEDKNTHYKSISMDDIRLDRLYESSLESDEKRPRQKQVSNGLPAQDMIFVQGREHRIHRDAKGDELYIYQPKSLVGSEFSTTSQRQNVYDYIDTDSRFEIQRPYVHVGHLNKY